MATNWDEAGREATSPENDYTNNEVAYHLATLANYSRTTYLLATLSPSRRAQSPLTPSAHWLLMATRYSSLYLPLHPTPYTPYTLHHTYTIPTPGQRCDQDRRRTRDRPLRRPSPPAVPARLRWCAACGLMRTILRTILRTRSPEATVIRVCDDTGSAPRSTT